jgi:hypothetical protein
MKHFCAGKKKIPNFKSFPMPKCNEKDCPVMASGLCINNFTDLRECPHYSEDTVDILYPDDSDSDDHEGDDNDKNRPEDLTVHLGKSLSLSELNEIALNNYTRLVILAGMHDVGKTTALLSLMHLFETNESFGGFVFSGCQTLVDFEQKAWPSRTDSGNMETDTDRTRHTLYADLKFLHLQLAEMEAVNVKKDLLFTDVSGELFKNIRDTKKDAQDFLIGKRADHFALFLDAGALSSPQKKVSARNSALGILKSLTENGMLTGKTRLQIIYSRWDLLLDSPNQATHLAYVDKLTKELDGLYSATFEMTVHHLACRPTSDKAEFGFGLEQLFKLWVGGSRLDFNITTAAGSRQVKDKPRHFSQYKFIK